MKNLKLFSVMTLALLLGSATLAHADYASGAKAFQAGNLSQAINDFKAFVSERPDESSGHFMLGWSYLRAKQTQEAVTHLRKAYDLNSKDANIQLRLGEAYVKARRYSDAVSFLSKINPSDLPGNVQGYLAQLMAVAKTKTGQSAVADLAKAAAADSGNATVHYNYGVALLNDGQTSKAVQALEEAARLDSGDTDKQLALAKALVKLGRTTRGSGKTAAYQKAASAAKKAVSANASFDNQMLLGGAQLGAKQYSAALSTFQSASSKRSSEWLPHFYIGQSYTSLKQHRSAEGSLKKALDHASSASDQTTIWKQLGFVYEAQKNYNKAIEAYNRVGDSAGVARVTENRDTVSFNKNVEAENKRIQELEAEQKALEAELKQLPGGKKPPGY